MRQCQGHGGADPARRVWAAAYDSSPPIVLLLRGVGRGMFSCETPGFHSEFLAYITGGLLPRLLTAFGLVAVALALLLVLAVAQCMVYVRRCGIIMAAGLEADGWQEPSILLG